MSNCDVLIDGEYKANERIYDESYHDGFHDAIGSGNQVIWDLATGEPYRGLYARDVLGIFIDNEGTLKYITNGDVDWTHN
jgi:hypothetical protein